MVDMFSAVHNSQAVNAINVRRLAFFGVCRKAIGKRRALFAVFVAKRQHPHSNAILGLHSRTMDCSSLKG